MKTRSSFRVRMASSYDCVIETDKTPPMRGTLFGFRGGYLHFNSPASQETCGARFSCYQYVPLRVPSFLVEVRGEVGVDGGVCRGSIQLESQSAQWGTK